MITADLVLADLPATSKKQALQALAEKASHLFNAAPEALMIALIDREKIGSTGIGGGTAIPHVKMAKASRLYAVLARLEKPVDYDAIDGKPVDIIFMLVAPVENKTTQHLRMLAQVSRFLRDAESLSALRSAADADAMRKILDDWASKQAA